MRPAMWILLATCVVLSGCGRSIDPPRGPLCTGDLTGVILLDAPVGHSMKSARETVRGGRVDIYDEFIVVTDLAGHSRVRSHDSYLDLRFRSD